MQSSSGSNEYQKAESNLLFSFLPLAPSESRDVKNSRLRFAPVVGKVHCQLGVVRGSEACWEVGGPAEKMV